MREATTSSVVLEALGIGVRFESNHPEVLALAANAFRPFAGARDVPSPPAGDPPRADVPVRITILVDPPGGPMARTGDGSTGSAGAGRADAGSQRLVHRVVGRTVLYGPGPVTAICEPDRREAIARIAPSLLDDPERLSREVVEALTLSVVTHLDRQPLHAAAVVREGAALLLCAPGGTGKSTLAYAAARAGLQVLADDAVYVQCRPALAIWGRPRALHLPPDAAAFFPELGSLEPRRMPNGKTKVVVPLAEPAGTIGAPRPSGAHPPILLSAGICLLDRGGPPEVRPTTPAEVEDAMRRTLDPGFDVFAATIGEPIRLLAAAGCWRLVLPPQPTRAVPLLIDMMKAASPAGR